jgi:hypothetical protein
MAENHGHSTWIAVFFERKNAAVIKLNDILPVHRAGILFCDLVLQGVNV